MSLIMLSVYTFLYTPCIFNTVVKLSVKLNPEFWISRTLASTLYSLQATIYSLQFTVYVYSLQSTVYSLQSTVYNLQSTIYSL